MIVPLIPLFLAASINVKEASDWKYGPEIIYATKIDGVSPALDASGHYVTFNTTVKLACRPKSELKVICIFNKPTVVLTLWKSVDAMSKTSKEYRVPFPDETIFEVDFDENNTSPLTVAESIDPARLDFVRALVDQLNFAANLTVKTGETFETVSTSITGKCNSTYVRSTSKVAEDDAKNSEANGNLSMIILPDTKVLKGEIQEFQKQVDIKSCVRSLRSAPYEVERRLLSAESHMIVSQNNFTTYTDNSVGLYNEPIWFFGRERITVTLDKVVPAEGPLPTVTDPLTFGIQATRVFHSDSTDIAYETKLYDDWLSLIDNIRQ